MRCILDSGDQVAAQPQCGHDVASRLEGSSMHLKLSPEDAAFREELRTYFTTEIPQEIRDAVAQRRELTKEQIVTAHKILNKAGYAGPHWPARTEDSRVGKECGRTCRHREWP